MSKLRRLRSRDTEYSLWAKDLVFVISDGYLDGMHAWLSAYHHVDQSSKSQFLLLFRSQLIYK
jgi:GPI-anchor transamidase subunit GAA1